MDAEQLLSSVSYASDETEFYAPMPAGYKPGKTKYVIVFGTVMSGLGKGIFSSSLAKLLKDKGLREYVEAAGLVRRGQARVRFQVLGQLDPANPSSIGERELQVWIEEGTIEHLGWNDDVRPWIAAADCVVLPSYREGTSRTLLEASAMARPVIATDVPGCRQVVEHGRTGYLCRVRDPRDLAEKMLQMIGLPAAERARLGAEGRRKMEREYDENIVIERYLRALREL